MAAESTGELRGTVEDSSGGAISGATVTVTNKVTNRAFNTKTAEDGSFFAPELEPGRYKVRFEMSGFGAVEVADVELHAGAELKVDAEMSVAPIQTAVTVVESAPLLDLTTATASHDVPAEEFDRVPKARSFQSLLLFSPSVNSGVDQNGTVVGIEGGFQVNGASASENQFLIDGVPTNSLLQGQSRQNAILEFLQDVQVKTGGTEAEQGGALGGVVVAVTKSGGNSFHGEVHDYFSGNRISAGPIKRLLLDPVTQATASYIQDRKQEDSRYEFGGSLGGYFIKDRLWFFAAASPQWRRAANDYSFSNGTEQGSIRQDQLFQSLFGKISFEPLPRIRTNFSWLNTPAYSTGVLPGYNSRPNTLVSSLAANQVNHQIGFDQSQSSYTGSVDILLAPKSVLSVRAGRFWDNYKDIGVPAISAVQYSTSALTLPPELLATVPVALRQPAGFNNTPRRQRSALDITAKSFVQADFAWSLNHWGSHELKLGAGTQKNVNRVDNTYPGGGFVTIFWGSSFRSLIPGSPCNLNPCRGTYGYYELDDFGTRGSAGANVANLYIQDNWRVHPRLTLSLGLRTEDEVVPSFRREIRDHVFDFDFADKIAPRLGLAYDALGNGKLKLSFGWGLFFDWVKYQLSRGTFGGSIWKIRYRALDSPDVFSLSGANLPGTDLWNPAVPDSFRDNRPLSITRNCTAQDLRNCIDPDTKPMSSALLNVTAEYQWGPHTVLRGSYIHNGLRRTIEDLGGLSGGSSFSYIANPGEGIALLTPPSGATPGPIATPKPVRTYDAMELSFSRHFAGGWFFNASYVLSRLYGNYTGLANSDEVITPTMGSTFAVAQQQAGIPVRPGTNTSRAYDLDEVLFDSRGHLDLQGRLPTDRPNVWKMYGSYLFKFGTEIGGFFYAASGTPISTYVNTTNGLSAFVNGRGDMGRTPILSQTDLLVAHEFKFTEAKRLRLEFNALNLFNQKTARHIFNCLNRGCQVSGQQSSAIDLSKANLASGYDYRALMQASPDSAKAGDPRYGIEDLFNPGFGARFGVKFVF